MNTNEPLPVKVCQVTLSHVILSLNPVIVAKTFPDVRQLGVYVIVEAVGAVVSFVTVSVLLPVDTLPAASVSVVIKLFAHSSKSKQ